MRHRLTGALLSGLGIALAGPALADKAIIAECRGNGAAFYLSDVPFDRVNDLAVEKGIGPAPSADAVFVIGDGRLEVAKAEDGSFGLLVLDAFSSDAMRCRSALYLALSANKDARRFRESCCCDCGLVSAYVFSCCASVSAVTRGW